MENVQEHSPAVEPDGKAIEPVVPPELPKKPKQREVSRAHLINKLNSINFQEGTVLVNFRHYKYDRTLSVTAIPQPCLEDILECTWASPDDTQAGLKTYRFQNLHVPDGHKLLSVDSDSVQITEKGVRLSLPETCLEFQARKRLRYACRDIQVQLIQNSVVFTGSLIDFTAESFRAEITARPPQTFQWFDPDAPATAVFSKGSEIIFAGECRIIRQTLGQKTRTFVLEPLNRSTHRFHPKQFRSSRYRLVPSPNIIFRHPLTGKMVQLNVMDLSGSGLSVQEDERMPVLLPGMMIPEVELNFAGTFKIAFRGQVINRKAVQAEGEDPDILCGLVFLDMNPEAHSKLLSILNQAKNRNAFLSNVVDPDALWDFFFETGFIYPKKYAFIQNNKEKIKAVYEKLYTQCPSIARHFVCQEKGRILGHMSMVRHCGNSWMIHHHAANASAYNQAGVVVLNQLNHYLNDTYKIYSAHLDLIFCYFRPENKFPMKVFGGAAWYMKDPKGCSLDTFAYFHCKKMFNNDLDLPEPWKLVKTCPEDLMELDIFYHHESGGLMLHALGLEPNLQDHDEVAEEYKRLGFKKARYLYSLKKEDGLKAIVLVNVSDIGLNLSDLTNCIHFIVLDPRDLPREIFHSAISMLAVNYEQDEMPVLIYPISYAEEQGIGFEKQYTLLSLNLHCFDAFLTFTSRLLRKY
ncbi:MAG: PilZ domain-containing protein [Desulfobacteraceae bacterium]|nr:MAG: PilZ domain-containing protein [Desulfobacteraceae bacterium]